MERGSGADNAERAEDAETVKMRCELPVNQHRPRDGGNHEQRGHAQKNRGVDQEDGGSDAIFAAAAPEVGFPLEYSNRYDDGNGDEQRVVLCEVHSFECCEWARSCICANLFHFWRDEDGEPRPEEDCWSEEYDGLAVCGPSRLSSRQLVSHHAEFDKAAAVRVTDDFASP